MDIFGIRHIANSPVAAITTGQLKRLTLAEVIVMRTPVLLADEISTGLDSATAQAPATRRPPPRSVDEKEAGLQGVFAVTPQASNLHQRVQLSFLCAADHIVGKWKISPSGDISPETHV